MYWKRLSVVAFKFKALSPSTMALIIGVSGRNYALKVGITDSQGLGFTTLYAPIFGKDLSG
jgi:hypothetical protein